MDKKDIVKKLLEHGVMATPEMLGRVNEGNINEFIGAARGAGKKNSSEAEAKILITVRKPERKQKASVQNFIEYYNSLYSRIKDMLVKKMSAISISNAKKSFSEVSVIGMVREVAASGFVLEDPTGEIEVILPDNNGINPDDVIGASGFVKESRLFARELVFPDIPLTRQIAGIDATMLLAADARAFGEIKETDIVLAFGVGKDIKERVVLLDSSPSWVTISKDSKELQVLVYEPGDATTAKQATEFLRKRNIPRPRSGITSLRGPFLIDPAPDIFWLVSGEKGVETYKGVTIISCGRGAARINLKTREVVFI